MAKTAIAVQNVPAGSGIQNVNLAAADSVNGMMFPNEGRTSLVILNNDVAAKTVTIASVPDENGRTGDIALVVPAASGGIPGIGICDTLPSTLFNQQNSDAGNVYVSFSAATNLKVAAVRFN
jgi:hypothetical protein